LRWSLALLLSLFPISALAHQASLTWSRVAFEEDGTVTYVLRLSSRDLAEALSLDRDRDATDEEIRAGSERLFSFVSKHLLIRAAGRPCPATLAGAEVLHQTDRFAELRFVASCAPPLDPFTIDYSLFFDIDPAHVGMLRMTRGGVTVTQEFTRTTPRFAWTGGAGLSAADYVAHGILHIFTGYDHIAFVLGLLLVLAPRPRPARTTLGVVTAFTLAHSLTLILAALEVVSLPSRLVESAIAASIVYVAVENVVLEAPRRRALLAFGFGLVHGLGFAAMLRPLLPPARIVPPLLLFNLGVELGQLALVLPALPLLVAAARRRPDGYRRFVIAASVVIGALGAFWLVQRAFVR
jgi:hypothetical protein